MTFQQPVIEWDDDGFGRSKRTVRINGVEVQGVTSISMSTNANTATDVSIVIEGAKCIVNKPPVVKQKPGSDQ